MTPRRMLLTLGRLKSLTILTSPDTGETETIRPHDQWLAWEASKRRFHICTVMGYVSDEVPLTANVRSVLKAHKKFHASGASAQPFIAECPTPPRGAMYTLGVVKSLIYTVPKHIVSPIKNKYLWDHQFGDVGHKGGGNYPESVMPFLRTDGKHLFIVRRPGNIFTVDKWIRG